MAFDKYILYILQIDDDDIYEIDNYEIYPDEELNNDEK